MEGILLGREIEGKIVDEENEFCDLDYSFNGETNEENGNDFARIRANVEIEVDATRVASDDDNVEFN